MGVFIGDVSSHCELLEGPRTTLLEWEDADSMCHRSFSASWWHVWEQKLFFDASTCFAFCLSLCSEMKQNGIDAVLRGSLVSAYLPVA